jgi:hypothetical protein
MLRDEIIWIYKKRTKHSVNFIPTGTTYSLVLRDTRGKTAEMSAPEQNIDAYLVSLREQAPWVIFGYNGELEKLYKKQMPAFFQVVLDRKKAIEAKKI